MSLLAPARAIALVAALEFVYILDFMMLLPLGPDLAQALHFPVNRLGWLSVAYTLASVLAGLIAIRWLDRFDRKSALLVCIGLFGITTLLAVTADSLTALIVFRALAGLSGGPAIALGMALIADSIPPAQRGAAMGKVMLGFSLAAILGVPMALEVSHRGGWTAPFYVVASLIALVWLAAVLLLPAMRTHLGKAKSIVTPRSLLAQPAVRAACVIQALSQFSAFLIIPHFSAYFLLNLGFPRDRLGLLYFVGGLASLVAVQVAGRLNDKIGAMPVLIVAVLCFALGLTPFFGWGSWTLLLPFVLFMVSNAIRNVTLATVCSQVPAATERAGFMSLQNMVQDVAIALAALVASVLLSTTAAGQLSGMMLVASLALLSTFSLPWAMSVLLRRAPLELEAA